MRKLISSMVALVALVGCGQDVSTKQTESKQEATNSVAPAGTPKMVIIRVKGKVTSMDAVKTGEARAIVDATREELSATADGAEKLFARGTDVTIAESIQGDDANEASTESWRWGWGGLGWGGWGGWGNNWGWNSLGFGWPAYNYYQPYYFYNYYTPYAYYSPYYYGGYSYFNYCNGWW